MLVTIDDFAPLTETRMAGANRIVATFTLRFAGATIYGCVLADTPKGMQVWPPRCKQREGEQSQGIRLSRAVMDEATAKAIAKLAKVTGGAVAAPV